MKTRIPAILIVLPLICLGLFPKAQAVIPPPDGGYPGFNTAEGQNALFSLTTGSANTAVGWFSLLEQHRGQLQHRYRRRVASFQHRRRKYGVWRGGAFIQHQRRSKTQPLERAALLNNTFGSLNTAVGAAALLNNEASSNTAVGASALFTNTTGDGNAAVGLNALVRQHHGPP